MLTLRTARAQEPAPSPCASALHHQFDFWIGSWIVRDSTGAPIGTNDVTAEAAGCALVEHWRGTSGSAGVSVNYVDGPSLRWSQLWVGGAGGTLEISGTLEGTSMVLSGERLTPQGSVHDRLQWTPLPDGRVRQTWEISTDGGTTWKNVFVGYYERARGSHR